jgi:hypothetical protein
VDVVSRDGGSLTTRAGSNHSQPAQEGPLLLLFPFPESSSDRSQHGLLLPLLRSLQ